MADQWYYACGENRLGPFSAGQLRELAAGGSLQRADTVWKAGTEKGVPAGKVKHLFPNIPAPAPAASATAAVTQELPSSGQPSDRPASLLACAAATVEPLSTATNAQEMPDNLQLLPDDSDWALAYAPAPSAAPGSAPRTGRAPEPAPALTAATDLQPQRPAATSPQQPGAKQSPGKKGRATGVRGVVIVSQDGERVHFRKKCVQCGHEDACRSTMLIRRGVTRAQYYCPKCRKLGEVVIQGVI